MSALLDTTLDAGHFAVCVKDRNKTVLMQNDECRSICGDCLGEVCQRGCMELYARDNDQQWQGWGSRVYKNSEMNGGLFDVTLLCSNDNIVTFLQPLKEKYEAALAYYQDKGLTRRETEVVGMSIKGVSNQQICDALSISKATLRTHLNNIYHKLRDQGEAPRFMPASRVTG